MLCPRGFSLRFAVSAGAFLSALRFRGQNLSCWAAACGFPPPKISTGDALSQFDLPVMAAWPKCGRRRLTVMMSRHRRPGQLSKYGVGFGDLGLLGSVGSDGSFQVSTAAM